MHRDLGPGRLFRKSAELAGYSESTLRRRALEWSWSERLKAYDAATFQLMASEGQSEAIKRYVEQLDEFRNEQLRRARAVGLLAEELLGMVERSLFHHLEASTVLQGRELPGVLAAACKALEGAMNIEASALGVTQLLKEFPD